MLLLGVRQVARLSIRLALALFPKQHELELIAKTGRLPDRTSRGEKMHS